MAKGFVGLLLVVLITCCVLSSFSNAKRKSKPNQCPRLRHKTNCTDKDDVEITECCLKRYKLGFDNLPSSYNISVEDPPSCALDVALAKCLEDSKCFRKPLTRNLRLLMFNQLIFTNRTGLCSRTKFGDLLREAKKSWIQYKFPQEVGGYRGNDYVIEARDVLLNYCSRYFTSHMRCKKFTEYNPKVEGIPRKPRPVKVFELKRISHGFDRENCAKIVYGKCGRQFSQKLKNNPGYDVIKLCRVFQEEGTCTSTEADRNDCKNSRLLNRFKENSFAAASIVLYAICT